MGESRIADAGRVRTADRIAGAALMAGAAASVFAMGHHPSGGHEGGLAEAVHGAMIVLLAGWTFGFAHFSVRRGLDRPAVLAGLIAFAISLFAHIGAATINGFVVPALAGRAHGPGGPLSHDLFVLAWESNQALARLGLFATGAAYLLWSADFLGRGTAGTRLIAAAGLLAGAVPAALLVGGWIRMDVGGAFIAYAVHAAWAALVGLHLWRGGLDRA